MNAIEHNGHGRNGYAEKNGKPRFPEILPEALPAQHIDAEQCVLSAIIKDYRCFDQVATKLEPQAFYRSDHETIYRAIMRLRAAGTPFDALILLDELERADELGAIGGAGKLAKIADAAPTTALVLVHADIVQTKYTLRRFVEAADEIRRAAYADTMTSSQFTAFAQAQIFEASRSSEVAEVRTASDVLQESMSMISRRAAGEIIGVGTGLADLDKQFGQFIPNGSLVIIGGRPSHGKTSIALRWMENASLAGVATLFLSLEMKAVALGERLLAGRARVASGVVKEAWDLTESQHRDLKEAHDEMKSAPFFVMEKGGLNMAQVAALARQEKMKHNIGIMFIDYMQLIQGSGENDSRLDGHEIVAKISTGLKNLAKELDIPIIALSQLNRQSEHRDGKRPALSDLRSSGQIEQDADIVFLMHRPERHNPTEKPGIVEAIIAKNREGPTAIVDLAFIAELSRVENLSRKNGGS